MSDPNVIPDSIEIKIGDEELKGRYANLLRITHSREEFVLDFIHLVPPQGTVVARVVTSPAHMKRLVNAVATNLARYEESFGSVPSWDPPGPGVH